MQLERLEPVVPPRLRRYLHRRRIARTMLERRSYGLRKPEETVPPENERITFHAVWAVEAYTPLHAETLFERLERLGFGRDDHWRRGGIRAQLETARHMPHHGSWLNLDTVFPPGSSGVVFGGIEAPLPRGIRCARPGLHALTPSVTLLVVQFVLDDDAATAFDALSREVDFKPQTQIRSNGVSLTPSDQVKQAALRGLRRELRERAASWVAAQLPGVFSSGLGGRGTPTAELVTTELAMPFARADDPRDYADFAGLGYDPLHWVSDELPHWRLTFDRDDQFVIVAARRPDVVADEHHKQYGDDERWALTYRAHEWLERDLALWAASRLLLAFHARVAAIRDQGLRHRRLQTGSNRLRKIRDEFLRDALDARVAAAELERYAENARQFEWQACDWKPSGDLPRYPDMRLLENLRQDMKENASALSGAEARLRDGLLVDSSVVATRASLRLNWWMLLITLVALLIAIASLVVAARAGDDETPAPAPAEVGTPAPQPPRAAPSREEIPPRPSGTPDAPGYAPGYARGGR